MTSCSTGILILDERLSPKVQDNVGNDVQIDPAFRHMDLKKRKLIMGNISLALAIICATILTYYFVTHGNQNTQAKVDANGNFSGLGNTSSPLKFNNLTAPPRLSSGKPSLYGYFGQNAIANGVDLKYGINSRNTSRSDYQKPLAYYCQLGYYQTINLAFLNTFGGGTQGFTIMFAAFSVDNYAYKYTYDGSGTETNPQWIINGFLKLGQDIKFCQNLGIKIMLSLGGDRVANYQFAQGDGVFYANLFYNMFLDGSGPLRPFGSGVTIDGLELDVEKNLDPVVWNREMIAFVQTIKKLSPRSLIAVVPQCFLGISNKDANVGDVITAVPGDIDYLIVQYYNNPECSYPFGFNFDAWKGVYSGPIVIGLAGDWTSAISGGFLEPGQLQAVYDMVKADEQFAGFSVYDVSSSNPPALAANYANYGHATPSTYSKTLRDVLDGVEVGSGFPSQGPHVTDLQLAYRCGGTWVFANSSCSNSACRSNSDCGPNEHCFSFLSKTC
ncbi:Chitinase 1 [Rhizoclosmatium sp. JEL0117]|nr:Chitinase 1 [Rhizoclosmatium sp. JEL0117]